MHEITQRIQQEARKLLQQKQVDVVVGYQRGWAEDVATPCFVTQESDVENLIFDEHCHHNLAKYLVGREGYLTSRFVAEDDRPKVAVVATPATLRTLVGLIQEHQLRRDAVVILGVLDGTPAGTDPDIEVGRIEKDADEQERISVEIQRLDGLSAPERQVWWEQQFAKCIRCYACRQVCPFCYCERCITDENQPQWIGRSPSLQNNTSWNVIRAFHLTGRCTGCGECDRVCPVNIPLSVLNAKMVAEVEEAFDYVAGIDMETMPTLHTFRAEDPEGFIK
ncbi:MAG: 4Fe-4S dicluster domain-containing protein [Anaerolineae bacterium]|nr:4Fe-4S dicluster domain-containing protein [Anaerolineae bacterium]